MSMKVINSFHVDTALPKRPGFTLTQWIRWTDQGVDAWVPCGLCGEAAPLGRSIHLDAEATSPR